MIIRDSNRFFRSVVITTAVLIMQTLHLTALDEVMSEKRMLVTMRTVGHELLTSSGDCDSRVLPIQFVDNQYIISFESEFGFDPGDVASIVDRVMSESNVANHYFVEVKQCETMEIVHSFEISRGMSSTFVPCVGRAVPKDCYQFYITVVDADQSDDEQMVLSDHLTNGQIPPGESSSFGSSVLVLSFLMMVGLIGFYLKNRFSPKMDPHLILVGATEFDKRNMRISFGDKSVELSNKEAELLNLLHISANQPVKREEILHKIWGDEGDYIGRTLDVFISKLRKKLAADLSLKIVNIRGIGYKLVVNA